MPPARQRCAAPHGPPLLCRVTLRCRASNPSPAPSPQVQDGFGVEERNGTCKACPPQATACTFNATGTFIDVCASGYGLDAASGQCKACGVEHCNSCDKLGAGFCDIYGW